MNFFEKRKMGIIAAMAIVGLLLSSSAFAVTSFGAIASNNESTVQSFASLAIDVFIFLGIALVGGGIFSWTLAHKRHEPTWPGIAMMIGGFLLASITAYISTGSNTVFGTNESQVTTLTNNGSAG